MHKNATELFLAMKNDKSISKDFRSQGVLQAAAFTNDACAFLAEKGFDRYNPAETLHVKGFETMIRNARYDWANFNKFDKVRLIIMLNSNKCESIAHELTRDAGWTDDEADYVAIEMFTTERERRAARLNR
jgi:hypothetical protein